MEFIHGTVASSSAVAALAPQYYILRERAFKVMHGEGFYGREPDKYDLDPSTVFCFAVENGRVIAGLRVLFHVPESENSLPFENVSGMVGMESNALEMQNLLPHLDVGRMKYAEISGVTADPDGGSRGLGTAIQQYAFDEIKRGNIQADVFVARVLPKNVCPMIKASRSAHISGVVRDDCIFTKDDIKRVVMMFSANPEFDFLSEKMKVSMVGVPPDKFLAKQYRGARVEKCDPVLL